MSERTDRAKRTATIIGALIGLAFLFCCVIPAMVAAVTTGPP